MRRDSIFYQLFQQFPSLLFQLVDAPHDYATAYRFESVAVKEAQFQIDGVFLPPETERPGTVYFCEVQFQRDEQLYERLFAELFLYFYRYRGNFSDWQAVIIYPHRNTEQLDLAPYAELLNSGKVHRIFIDELGEPENLSPELGLMRLTIESEINAPQLARTILTKAEESTPNRQAIIDLVTTIMVYKFTQLSRQEVEAMLGFTVNELQKSRFYQEVKAEGRQEGELIGTQRGLQLEAQSLVLRQLTRKFGDLSMEIQNQVESLGLTHLEELAVALLEFETVVDVANWLQRL